MRINVELLSFEPVIVVYRNIIPRSKVEAFLNELKWKKVSYRPLISGSLAACRHKNIRLDSHRSFEEDEWKRKTREHGAYPEETTMLYGEGQGTFEALSTMIPAVNFAVSEPWKVGNFSA